MDLDWVAIFTVLGILCAAIKDLVETYGLLPSPPKKTHPLDRLSFWGYWVLLTMGAWGINGLIDENDTIAIIIGGIAVGLLQWMVLKNNVKNALWWVPPTALGWYVSWEVDRGSIALAIFQYIVLLIFVLKIPRFTWWFWWGLLAWLITTSIGWFLGWQVSDAFNNVLDTDVLGQLLGGALNGAITGIVMFYLLRFLTPIENNS